MSNGLINRQYVGARYVPKIMGEWNKTLQYEALSVVTYMGNSFTSKVPVPANSIDINNTDYWVNTGNYNAQIDELTKVVKNYKTFATPKMYGAIGDGVTDDTLAILNCIYNNDNILLDMNYLVHCTNNEKINIKKVTVNYCFDVSNKNILITGTIHNTDIGYIFKCNNTNINGNYTIISTFDDNNWIYKNGFAFVNEGENVSVSGCHSNNAILSAFNSKNIKAEHNYLSRTNTHKIQSMIGCHLSNNILINNNTLIGTLNDGDILCYGGCKDISITNNYLNANCDVYTDNGAQGIVLDSGSINATISFNKCYNYYAPIDIKTLADKTIVSNNLLTACKFGIRVTKGEQNNINNDVMFCNNIMDISNRTQASPIPTFTNEKIVPQNSLIYVDNASITADNNVLMTTYTTDLICGCICLSNTNNTCTINNTKVIYKNAINNAVINKLDLIHIINSKDTIIDNLTFIGNNALSNCQCDSNITLKNSKINTTDTFRITGENVTITNNEIFEYNNNFIINIYNAKPLAFICGNKFRNSGDVAIYGGNATDKNYICSSSNLYYSGLDNPNVVDKTITSKSHNDVAIKL